MTKRRPFAIGLDAEPRVRAARAPRAGDGRLAVDLARELAQRVELPLRGEPLGLGPRFGHLGNLQI